MIVQIDFNHETDGVTLKKLASIIETHDEYTNYFIEISTIDEVKELLSKVNKIKNPIFPYGALIDFDDEPFIYFDNKNLP